MTKRSRGTLRHQPQQLVRSGDKPRSSGRLAKPCGLAAVLSLPSPGGERSDERDELPEETDAPFSHNDPIRSRRPNTRSSDTERITVEATDVIPATVELESSSGKQSRNAFGQFRTKQVAARPHDEPVETAEVQLVVPGLQQVALQASEKISKEIVAYAEEHSCQDAHLYLRILDLGMRLAMLDERNGVGISSDERETSEARCLVREAQDDIVAHVTANRCQDLRLKVKIMELGTRLKLAQQ